MSISAQDTIDNCDKRTQDILDSVKTAYKASLKRYNEFMVTIKKERKDCAENDSINKATITQLQDDIYWLKYHLNSAKQNLSDLRDSIAEANKPIVNKVTPPKVKEITDPEIPPNKNRCQKKRNGGKVMGRKTIHRR